VKGISTSPLDVAKMKLALFKMKGCHIKLNMDSNSVWKTWHFYVNEDSSDSL